jgi:hypothetical protein
VATEIAAIRPHAMQHVPRPFSGTTDGGSDLLSLSAPAVAAASAVQQLCRPKCALSDQLEPNVEAGDLSEFELTSRTLALKLEQSRWPQIVRGRTRA